MASATQIPIDQGNSTHDECSLPIAGPDGQIVYFDVQSAETGTFTFPGVSDLHLLPHGELVQLSWIYFKGDPMAGPRPHHPFEMPFDNHNATFTLDVVRESDASKVLWQVMSPTNASVFWRGGAPFGQRGSHSMRVLGLDSSCRYDFIGEMAYRWRVPKAIDTDSSLRVRLTTTHPLTQCLSERFEISSTSTSPTLAKDDLMTDSGMAVGAAGLAMLLIVLWALSRTCLGSKRTALR